VRAGMIHYQFEVIHPFLDGNGRIGRLLIILLLYEWKLLPQPLLNLSVYFEHYRQEYYDRLLAVSQHGKWEEWLIFFLRGIGTQAQESIASMARLQGMRHQYDAIVHADRNPTRMAHVIDFLFARPIFTNRQLASALNMPFKTAADYIEKLMRAGILEETTGYARNRVFRSNEILRALEGLESP
jgi:Fic family protein